MPGIGLNMYLEAESNISPLHTSLGGNVVGPHELKMKLDLTKIKSGYVDTFDWGIYDKIAAKFGDEQPRGGVVFKTGLKLVNHHSSCSKCHYAFEIDTYGRGCTHNCNFCYAKEILTRHGYWNQPHPFPVNLAEIKKIFYKVFETSESSKWRNVLEKRVPLRLGSMSDCFMWMDRKYKVTYELLKILDYYQYPYIIFTRSDLVATDEYMRVLNKDLCSIQFSICSGNEKITKIMEPGAPKVEKRLNALKTLAENGFWTTVRINPLFPIYPDGYFTDEQSIINRFGSYSNVPSFDFFDWSLIDQLKQAKVPSLLAGFVRLTPFAVRAIQKDTGVDFAKFFKPELYNTRAESKYSEAEVSTYYRHLKAKCDQTNIRFNTCYIGNGINDYYQHQSMWSNKSDCCDARGNVKLIQSSSQEVPWDIRRKHSQALEVAFETERIEIAAETIFTPQNASASTTKGLVIYENTIQ
jgi:DNA repair photolyase